MVLSQSSFRRILLSRLLLVSVPVLLMGVYVTYRKARSAFLESARQNLTESAVRKADSIDQLIEALQTNLVTASDSVVLKEGSLQEKQSFLEQLATKLPTQIECVQLTDLNTGQLMGSTCGKQLLDPSIASYSWKKEQKDLLTDSENIYVKNLLPTQLKNKWEKIHQLNVLFTAPVYDNQGQLKYGLSIHSALLYREKVSPGSLAGYPVVINQEGTILAHPFPERIGRNIQQEADRERLKMIIRSAIAGRQDFLHLFSFEKDGVELVAGYSSLPSPVTNESQQKWIILAVSPLEDALAPLGEIKEVLFYMVMALLIVSFLAIIYISRELSRPLEKLRDYALNKDNIHSRDQIPQNFNIREFNQLATALKEMIEHLKAWGEEVISSWEEAQNANRLKNEFLANTSHELRTPLNGIIGCVRIIKDGFCDSHDEEEEFLQQADDAAVHLLEIINDILDIAKIEAGKLSVSPQPVDLRKILTEVVNLQWVQIQKKGLKLNLSEWEPTTTVYADPAKFKQVLLNIIGNAVKFTEIGSISIITHTEESMAIVTIKDTGIGIDPSHQNKLFRPFVMIDGTTTRKFSGTGLGLAISKNLMELMAGNITLFSAGLGKGTTVEISIPLAEAALSCDVNGHSVVEVVSV